MKLKIFNLVLTVSVKVLNKPVEEVKKFLFQYLYNAKALGYTKNGKVLAMVKALNYSPDMLKILSDADEIPKDPSLESLKTWVVENYHDILGE